MSDKRPEDQDNEPTRIVQRPGPQSPVQLGGGIPGAGPTPVAPRAPAPVDLPPIAPRPAPPVYDPPPASLDPDATRVASKPRLTPPGQPVPRPVAPPVSVQPASVPPAPVPPVAAQPIPVQPAPRPVAPQPVSPAPAAQVPPPAYAAPEPAPAPYVPPPPAAPAMEAKHAMAEAMMDKGMAEKPMTMEKAMEKPTAARRPAPADPVVGWVVVIKGPGRGSSREVYSGRNAIGSDPEQLIPIDFGDPAFARRGHAFIVYDNEAREFFIEDGKQKELVRVNGRLLSETSRMHHGDEIRIGQTTLKFVALCGPEFDWADQNAPKSDAAPKETAPKEPMMAKEPAMAPKDTGAGDAAMDPDPSAEV